jgi:hypothetical protein
MINTLKDIMDYIGVGNIISIVTFIIGIFISYYLYFKSFYRLIYVSETICKTCEKFLDRYDGKNELITRIIFYNNGRKTLSKDQIDKLEIISEEIKEIFAIKATENLSVSVIKNKGKIIIGHLDSSEFIVFEVTHKGKIDVVGRVAETGKLLYKETRIWVIINAIIILPMIISLYYFMFTYLGKDEPEFIPMFIYLIFLLE